MTATVPGVKVTTDVVINDPAALGEYVATLGSDAQAQFLLGMANGFLADWGPLQMAYIEEDVAKFAPFGRQHIRRFVDLLSAHLGSEAAR